MGACCVHIESFCTNRDNHLARFMEITKGPDKTIKVAQKFFDLTAALVDMTDASTGLKKGLHSVTAAFRDTRTIIGLGKVFTTLFDSAYNFGKESARLIGEIYNNEGKRSEKSLELGVTFGGFISCLTTIGGFGFIRPVSFADKHFDLGKTAHDIGQTFPLVMMIGDISGLITNTLQLVRCKLGHIDLEKVKETVVGLLEKLFEVCVDTIKLFRIVAVPALVTMILALIAAIFSFYGVWLKTS